MKLVKAIIVCSVLAVPFITSAAEIGSTRLIPGLGDADGDGLLTERDVTIFGNYLFAGGTLSAPAGWCMDFDQDGRVSILDLRALAWVVGGYASTMPAMPQRVTVGDVNGDGTVTNEDAEELFYFLYVEGEVPAGHAANGDVNGDNQLDIVDVIELARQVHERLPR